MNTTQPTYKIRTIPGTFCRWAKYRKLFADIQEVLARPNGVVQISTVYRSTVYYPKHASMFSVSSNGVFVQRGKAKDDISGCSIRFGRTA